MGVDSKKEGGLATPPHLDQPLKKDSTICKAMVWSAMEVHVFNAALNADVNSLF